MKTIYILAVTLWCAGAASAPFPIVTQLTVEPNGPGEWTYRFTQTLVDSPVADALFPYSSIRLGHKHSLSTGGYNITNDTVPTRAIQGDTWSSIAMRAYVNDKEIKVIHHVGGVGTDECVGYLGANATIGAPWEDGVSGPLGCTHMPPLNNTCSFQSPSIVIDHGRRTLTNITGSIKTADVPVTCQLPTKITISMLPDRLDLGGITAVLSTDPTLDVGAAGATLHLKSTLELDGHPETGLHEAAGVVRLDYE